MPNDLQIDFQIVVKMSVDIEHLVWAFYYQHKIEGKPFKKVSKSSTIKFLKDQMYSFGCRHDSLIGSCAEEITEEMREKYLKRIEELFERR